MQGDTYRFLPALGDPNVVEAKLRGILENIDYPDYKFTLIRCYGADGGCQFFLMMRKQNLPDATMPGAQLEELQYYSIALGGQESVESLVRGVFEQIQAMELHEVAEKFHFKGRRVYAPHEKVE